jgi:hypothetical protein
MLPMMYESEDQGEHLMEQRKARKERRDDTKMRKFNETQQKK